MHAPGAVSCLAGNVEPLKNGQKNTLAAARTESQAFCAEKMLTLLFIL